MIPESINQDKAGLTPASPVPLQREPLAKGDCTHPLPLPHGSFPQSQSGEGGVGGLTYWMLCLKEQSLIFCTHEFWGINREAS